MTRARDLGDFIADGGAPELVVDTTTLVVDSTNNRVGVGTATPSAALDVTGDVSIADKIIHTGDTNTAIRFPAADTVTVETGGSERMRVDSSGKVGIGTSSPSTPLHVVGNNGILVDTSGNGDGQIYFGGISGSDRSYLSRSTNDFAIWNVSSGVIKLATNDTERFRFGSAGQLGIGGATYGTSGQVLTSGGSSAAPSWADASGGGSFEFTASSALSSGQAAILASNGQVKPASLTVGTLTSVDNPYNRGNLTQNNDIVYQAKNGSNNVQNMIQVWTDPSNGSLRFSNYIRNANGTFSSQGETILNSSSCDYSRVAYNPDLGACLAISTSGNDDIKAYSFYADVNNNRQHIATSTIDSDGNYTGSAICYDEGLDKFVVCFQRGNDTWVYLITQNANYSITVNSQLQLNLNTAIRNGHVATNNSGQFAYLGGDTTNSRTSVVTFSISGTTITAGSVTQVSTSDIGNTYGRSAIIYDSTNSAWLAGYYYRSGIADWVYMRTITISSNTATVGSSQPLIQFSGNNTEGSVTFAVDSVGGIVGFYGNSANKNASKQITITNTGSGATGLTISTGSEIVLSNHSTSYAASSYGFEAASSGDASSTFVQYMLSFNSPGNGLYVEGAEKSITSDNSDFIGFAEGAISQGASGKITHFGGINENQSGLTINTTYYVGLDGTLQTTDSGVLAGKAVASTKILVKG